MLLPMGGQAQEEARTKAAGSENNDALCGFRKPFDRLH
jgi:hypothetical protein